VAPDRPPLLCETAVPFPDLILFLSTGRLLQESAGNLFSINESIDPLKDNQRRECLQKLSLYQLGETVVSSFTTLYIYA
jgi:hypothetical protein